MRRGLLILLLLLLPSLAPLAYPGFIRTLVTFLPAYRVAEPDWNPLGEGGFLAYWIASFLVKAGLPGAETVKALWALSLVLGGTGVFFLARRSGVPAALLASALYVYSPFILAAVYVRGELEEPLFWGLLPWLLVAISPGEGHPWASVLASGLTLILASVSPGLALFALAAGVLYALLHRCWLFPLLSVPALSAFYLLNWGSLPPPNPGFFAHFVLPFQFFSAWWGVKPSAPGWIGEMPFQMGVAPLALAILAIPGWAKARDREGSFALALSAIPLLLALPVASPFWKLTCAWKLLRYPWEALGFAALGLALLGGLSLKYIPSLGSWPAWAGIVALVLLGSYRYLEPQFVPYTPRTRPLAVVGEDNAILVDCSLAEDPEPGGKLEVRLLWQALKPFDRDYSVFAHLLDAQGKKWAQRDQPPLNGEKPTSSWSPGELVEDTYVMPLSADLPEGPFFLATGIYRWDTGERLRVRGREDGQALIPLGWCRKARAKL